MPTPSFSCAEGDRFDLACSDEGVFCLGNTDDWDLCNSTAPPTPSLLPARRLAAFMLECFPGPRPADFIRDRRLRSTWLSDFARRVLPGDSGEKTVGVSGNVWYPVDAHDQMCDDDVLGPGLTVRS